MPWTWIMIFLLAIEGIISWIGDEKKTLKRILLVLFFVIGVIVMFHNDKVNERSSNYAAKKYSQDSLLWHSNHNQLSTQLTFLQNKLDDYNKFISRMEELREYDTDRNMTLAKEQHDYYEMAREEYRSRFSLVHLSPEIGYSGTDKFGNKVDEIRLIIGIKNVGKLDATLHSFHRILSHPKLPNAYSTTHPSASVIPSGETEFFEFTVKLRGTRKPNWYLRTIICYKDDYFGNQTQTIDAAFRFPGLVQYDECTLKEIDLMNQVENNLLQKLNSKSFCSNKLNLPAPGTDL